MTTQEEFNTLIDDYSNTAKHLANFLQTTTLQDLADCMNFKKLEDLRFEVIQAHLALSKFLMEYNHKVALKFHEKQPGSESNTQHEEQT